MLDFMGLEEIENKYDREKEKVNGGQIVNSQWWC